MRRLLFHPALRLLGVNELRTRVRFNCYVDGWSETSAPGSNGIGFPAAKSLGTDAQVSTTSGRLVEDRCLPAGSSHDVVVDQWLERIFSLSTRLHSGSGYRGECAVRCTGPGSN